MVNNEVNKGHILPNHPANPGIHPDHPAHPEHPEHPDHPTHPDHPVHPDKPEKPTTPLTVIVNGADKELPPETTQLSYEQVVVLAYGNYNNASNIIYSIAYSHGPIENKKGVLVKGDCVFVKAGMIFNVGCSNKS